MPDIAFVNDRFMPLSEASISVEDRGFQFGDGVYEMLRTYGGAPFRPHEHLARLERSAAALGIALPFPRERWLSLIDEAASRAAYLEAKIYIQVTRGAAPRDHAGSPELTPTVVLTVRALDPPDAALYARGVNVVTLSDTRWAHCDIKAIALLPNVLAKQRAVQAGAFEAIFVRDGLVLEGATSNLFIELGGTLRTAPEGRLILSGITRQETLRVAQEAGLAVKEEPVSETELDQADEAFLTGTTIELMPVARVNGRPISPPVPGPVTSLLMARFRALHA